MFFGLLLAAFALCVAPLHAALVPTLLWSKAVAGGARGTRHEHYTQHELSEQFTQLTQSNGVLVLGIMDSLDDAHFVGDEADVAPLRTMYEAATWSAYWPHGVAVAAADDAAADADDDAARLSRALAASALCNTTYNILTAAAGDASAARRVHVFPAAAAAAAAAAATAVRPPRVSCEAANTERHDATVDDTTLRKVAQDTRSAVIVLAFAPRTAPRDAAAQLAHACATIEDAVATSDSSSRSVACALSANTPTHAAVRARRSILDAASSTLGVTSVRTGFWWYIAIGFSDGLMVSLLVLFITCCGMWRMCLLQTPRGFEKPARNAKKKLQ